MQHMEEAMQAVRNPYRAAQQVTFDRLAVKGGKIKIFRRDNSVQELRRGVRQLAELTRAGAKFEEVLIQIR